MKILRQVTSTQLVDIGPLDHQERLPMKGRIAHGMATRCNVCGEEITDEYFIVGLKGGYRNLLLHERCAEEEG